VPSIAIVSDFVRAFSNGADGPNATMLRRRHRLWAELARHTGWDLNLVDASKLEAADSSTLGDPTVAWIDQPLLPREHYRRCWSVVAKLVPGIGVFQKPDEVEQVYGLDQSFPRLLRAGLAVPKTAFVPIDEATVQAIHSPEDVRRLLIERIYEALFAAGIDPHEGVFVRGYYSSAKSRNAELFFGRNQADLEATSCELIGHLRDSLEVGGLALREYLELDRLELVGGRGPRDVIRVSFELRITVIARRVRLVSFHGPFERLVPDHRRQLERILGERRSNFLEAEKLVERIVALDFPEHFVADLAFDRSGRALVIELNPLYASGYNVPFAHAYVLAALGSHLASLTGRPRLGDDDLLALARKLLGSGEPVAEQAWMLPTPP
jgi:hypothetical protein